MNGLKLALGAVAAVAIATGGVAHAARVGVYIGPGYPYYYPVITRALLLPAACRRRARRSGAAARVRREGAAAGRRRREPLVLLRRVEALLPVCKDLQVRLAIGAGAAAVMEARR